MQRLLRRFRPGQEVSIQPTNTEDLIVRRSGAAFTDEGTLDHLWYEVEEREAGQTYYTHKVIKLRMLTQVPIEVREDPNILGKMVTVLRGLYNAQVDFIHLHAGVFDNPALGILQIYGVVGVSETSRDDALQSAELGLVALLGAMANYPQVRFAPLDTEKARWLIDALHGMPHALSVVGQPDPRELARGMGRKPEISTGQSSQPPGEVTAQQNEMFMRGMAKTNEEYLMLTLASRAERDDLTVMLEGIAGTAGVYASRQQGTRAISLGVALPMMLGAGSGHAAGSGYTEGAARGASESRGVADGTSHVEGTAHTEGHGWSRAHGISEGEAHTVGRSHSESHGVTVGRSRVDSENWSRAASRGVSEVDGVTVGRARTQGTAHGVTESRGAASTTGTTVGTTVSEGQNTSVGADVGVRVMGIGVGGEVGHGWTESQAASRVASTSHTVTVARADSHVANEARTASRATSHAVGTSESRTQAHGRGAADGTSRGVSHATVDTRSEATTRSRSESWMAGESGVVSDSRSVADGVSHTESHVRGVNRSNSMAQGRTYAISQMATAAVGISPHLSLSKTYRWEDDVAIRLTQIFRQQEALLDAMSKEGGYLTDVYVLTRTEQGKKAAQALVPQAFHGTDEVVTPVLTRSLSSEEEEHLRLHAACFTPCAAEETVPNVMSGYRHSSLLTMLQVAAYTAPGIFEEGVALTTQEAIPPFAFLPDMEGEVVLGHLLSTETANLTHAPVRLSQDRMFHTVFAGNTGYGKSVAAERLALETTVRWKYRTIVLDFGQGWREMLTAPGLEGHVDLYQLQPGAVRPLRWNPLQIGKRIAPEQQFRALCDLFANAGGMGPRQLGYMRRALIGLYRENGVLTADKQVLGDENWNTVADRREEDAISARMRELGLTPRPLVGRHLADLNGLERQALAVYRSRRVDITDWYERLVKIKEGIPRRSVSEHTSIEGVLLRFEPFTYGEMGLMYGKERAPNRGAKGFAIEDVSLPWGMTVFEGGAELDEYAKVALLSMMAWHLYTDAVRRRREDLNHGGFDNWMQIFFEEANKVLAGASLPGVTQEADTPTNTVQQFLNMWRDGRKYRIWLHLMVQSPSTLPAGIIDSCNNAFVSQLKEPRDRDLMMAHIALSEKGFTDEQYKRYVSRMAVARSIVKLGYSRDRRDVQPMLVEPLKVPAREPTDMEIYQRFMLRG